MKKPLAIVALGLVALVLGNSGASQAQVGSNRADLPNLRGTFAIHNQTGVTIRYQVKWGNEEWKRIILPSGRVERHSYPLNASNRAPTPYVRFDSIGGDGKVTWKSYRLEFRAVGFAGLAQGYLTEPKHYRFRYSPDGRVLDLKAQ